MCEASPPSGASLHSGMEGRFEQCEVEADSSGVVQYPRKKDADAGGGIDGGGEMQDVGDVGGACMDCAFWLKDDVKHARRL